MQALSWVFFRCFKSRTNRLRYSFEEKNYLLPARPCTRALKHIINLRSLTSVSKWRCQVSGPRTTSPMALSFHFLTPHYWCSHWNSLTQKFCVRNSLMLFGWHFFAKDRELLDSRRSAKATAKACPFSARTFTKACNSSYCELGEHLSIVEEGGEAKGTRWNVREDSKQFSQIPRGSAFSWWFLNMNIFQEHMCESSKETEQKVPWSIIAFGVEHPKIPPGEQNAVPASGSCPQSWSL